MKFRKQILLTLSLFGVVVGGSIVTSCEPNSCDGVTCFNGGSCGGGICTCPSGYEGAQCQTRKIDRFLGTYAGFTTCDHGAQVIDTVTIVEGTGGPGSVEVFYRSVYPKLLQGYVSNNESVYSIKITNNDSSKRNTNEYLRYFAITLQSNKTLKLHTYEYEISPLRDTDQISCEFVGVKTR
jgi:hypothetical protein